MARMGFETTIAALELAKKFYALDLAAAVIVPNSHTLL
jgi:hypothetical protein